VVVADGQTVLREHLASLLARSGFDAVGRAGDAPSSFSLLKERRPPLAVVDIRMPATHSSPNLDIAGTIRQALPHTGILLLSKNGNMDSPRSCCSVKVRSAIC
jgi:DNA-binding NarL/FixJ family response regulator